MFNFNVYPSDVVHKSVSVFLGDEKFFSTQPLDDRYDSLLPTGVYTPRVLVKALRTRMLQLGYDYHNFYAHCVNIFKELTEVYPFDERREKLNINGDVLVLSYPNDTVHFTETDAMITVTPDNIVKADSTAMFYSELLANIFNVPEFFRDHAYHISPQLHNVPRAVYESWLYLHYMRNNAAIVKHECDGFKQSFNKNVNKWLHDTENVVSLPELVFKKVAPREARKPDGGSNWFMEKFPHLVKLGESDNISLHFDERTKSDYPLIVSDTIAMVHLAFNFPCREASQWEQQNMGSFFNIMFAVMNHRKDDMLERGGFIFGRFISDNFYEEFIESMLSFTVDKEKIDFENDDELHLKNTNDIVKMFATGVTVDEWGKLEGLPEEWLNKL